MSLLDAFARNCVLMKKTSVPGMEGGCSTVWSEDLQFLNYQAMDRSMEARVAEQLGVSSVYSALVDRDLPVHYGDYFKDRQTGWIYRVTSRPEEKQAPASASLRLKYFTAERTALPT